jgi:outer membrane murein-binding lipoprotein Lpp
MAKKELASAVHPLEQRIHIVRGQKILLDTDLAALYQVQPFRLNEAVKRNRKRFPEDFMFQLTRQEVTNLTSQIAMSSLTHGGRRTLPYAFTEHGVAMLSSVLNSVRAIEMNIAIFRAFVRMRELMVHNKELAARMEKLERKQDRTASVIEVLVEDIDKLADDVKQIKRVPQAPKRKIGFSLSK